jgi:hypothetical protein
MIGTSTVFVGKAPCILIYIQILDMCIYNTFIFVVVPHKAVVEVSKKGHYRGGELL